MSPKSGNDIAYGCEAGVNISGWITVWDTLVRVFHWSLVVAVSIAVLTGIVLGATWIEIYILAGGGAVALILMRILWGAVGSTYAHFRHSSFVVGPRATWRAIQDLRNGSAPPRRWQWPQVSNVCIDVSNCTRSNLA